MNLLELQDINLLKIFGFLPLNDLLQEELVCKRFFVLIQKIWQKKFTIVWPYDLREIFPQFRFSSFLDDFGSPMRILMEHCPNIEKLQFSPFRRLQIIFQPSAFENFQKLKIQNLQIFELHFGQKYVTDKDVIAAAAQALPELRILRIDDLFPLLYELRSDTIPFLRRRIPDLDKGLEELMNENQRISEDIRYILELFPNLRLLQMKSVEFQINSSV